jgi:DNA mismatch endonuclease (patch repair protein)
MTDIFSKEARSRIMRGAKSKNTKPELKVRKALWGRGLRYRIHYRLPGSPDIVFPSKKLAIFVNGCFWHGCRYHGRIPSTNTSFWKSKIARNMQRDKENTKKLRNAGWKVFTFWEHQLTGNKDIQEVIAKIIDTLNQ